MAMQNPHYFNGKWLTEDHIHVSPMDLAVLRGFGVFDFMTSTNGVVDALDDHLNRYDASARSMGLPMPVSIAELQAIVAEGITRSRHHRDLFIRIILTGGISEDFITPGKPNFMILFHPARRPLEVLYQNGANVITYAHQRSKAEVKSLGYAEAVIAMRLARSRGAFEALYFDEVSGRVLEGTSSNVFGVKDGSIITPQTGILKGVTRSQVIRLSQSMGIQVAERPVLLKELLVCDEVFLTSSIMSIMPVRKIDDCPVKIPVGPLTSQLLTAMRPSPR